MGTDRAVKAAALTEVNRAMRQLALEDSPAEAWEFFCECGEADCEERVSLTIDAYDHLQEQHKAVVAHAHHQIERASRLGEEERALATRLSSRSKRAPRTGGPPNSGPAERSPSNRRLGNARE